MLAFFLCKQPRIEHYISVYGHLGDSQLIPGMPDFSRGIFLQLVSLKKKEVARFFSPFYFTDQLTAEKWLVKNPPCQE